MGGVWCEALVLSNNKKAAAQGAILAVILLLFGRYVPSEPTPTKKPHVVYSARYLRVFSESSS
jgi:hypothetical protein